MHSSLTMTSSRVDDEIKTVVPKSLAFGSVIAIRTCHETIYEVQSTESMPEGICNTAWNLRVEEKLFLHCWQT